MKNPALMTGAEISNHPIANGLRLGNDHAGVVDADFDLLAEDQIVSITEKLLKRRYEYYLASQTLSFRAKQKLFTVLTWLAVIWPGLLGNRMLRLKPYQCEGYPVSCLSVICGWVIIILAAIGLLLYFWK